MATALQEDLAEAIVKNRMLPQYKRKNKTQLVASVGYSAKTARKKATELIEARGVQETLIKAGLTQDFIKEALIYDIENKPKRRVRELELGAAILGMTEHAKNGVNNMLIVVLAGESATRYGIQTSPDPRKSSE